MEQLLPYFREAEKVLDRDEWDNNNNNNEDSKSLFIQNVLIEMDGLEYRLSFHHDGSKLVEKFLQHANEYQLRVFFEKLGGPQKVEAMAQHRYASHVIEKWIILALSSTEHSNKGKDEGLLTIDDILLLLEGSFRQSFLSLTENLYATHVIRNFLDFYTTNSSLLNTLLDEVKPRLVQVLTNAQQAPTLLRLLEICCKEDATKTKAIEMFKPKNEREFLIIASDPSGSAFLEGLIHHLSQKDRIILLDMLGEEEFSSFLKDANANYVLQAFLVDQESLNIFMSLLKPFVNDLIPMLNRPGLLIRMASLAQQIGSSYSGIDELLSFIVDHFQSPKLKNILLMSKESISNAGSSLLILLGNPSLKEKKSLLFIRKELREIDSSLLLEICQHKISSRFLELVLDDVEWSKRTSDGREFISKFLDIIEPLSISGPASHVLERVFKGTNGEGKLAISKVLSENRLKLQNLPWGRQLLRKFEVEDWERLGDEEMLHYWKEEDDKENVRKRLLSDILGDNDSDDVEKKKKKKKKRMEK